MTGVNKVPTNICDCPVSYPSSSASRIQWDHEDGPVFFHKDGTSHWLSILERVRIKLRLLNVPRLEKTYNYNTARTNKKLKRTYL